MCACELLDSKACSQVERDCPILPLANIETCFLHVKTQAFSSLERVSHAGFRHKNTKLFAPVPHREIFCTHTPAKHPGKLTKNVVADVVATVPVRVEET